MASPVPHKDAWTRARDRYIEDLNEEERALYATASPESIFYDASAAEKVHASSSSGIKIADKLAPLIAAIEQYSKALDVYANAYPLVLSPLWGSIRIVLHLASEFTKYFERIVDMFARIGDLLPRFRVYENLFPSHERLVQALSVVYVDVLTFCTEAKAVLRRERRSLKIVFKLSWKPFDRQFGQQIDKFRVHVSNVEKEASLSHKIEASDSRAIVRANQKQLEKAKREDAQRRIIAAIPSVDNMAQHRKLGRLRQDGTSTWILRHDVYQDWYDAKCSSTICCFGIPGCGKTMLSSFIVNSLQADAVPTKARIVYYYCDYADPRTLQAERILGTILKQLFVSGHIPEIVERKLPRGYGEDAQTLDIIDLIDLVCLAIEQTSLTFVILDGLDECDKNSRKDISSLLARLRKVDTSIVKIFITCRQEDQMLRSLQEVPKIHITSSALENDIRAFVAASVSERVTSGELRLRDPNLADEVTDELVERAHGMFLWVSFQLDDLCEAPSDNLIRQTLRDLPNGLIETYERVLSKIWHGTTVNREVVRKIFMWMLCAQRPLEIEELREAAGFEPDQKSWSSEMLPDADLIIEACKGLVIWDREDGIVRFAHHTVQQFLLHSDQTGNQTGDLQCSHNEAELHVGEMCLTYLLFSDFETQIQVRPAQNRTEQPSDVPQAGPAYWIPEMLGVRSSKLERPFRLLGLSPSSPALDIDLGKQLRSASELKHPTPSSEVFRKYSLLQYIIDHWVLHTKGFDHRTSLSRKLQDLAMYKTLPFEFRPWGRNRHYGKYGCSSCKPGSAASSEAEKMPFMSLLHYAAEAGHWPLMESQWIEEYLLHDVPSDNRQTFQWDEDARHWLLGESLVRECRHPGKSSDWTICIAIRNGHVTMVERLLSRYYLKWPPNFHATIINAVVAAPSCGHKMIFGSLLEYLQSSQPECLEKYVREYGHIILALAAANGHQAIVEGLCQEGVPVDKKIDKYGETPISAASASGHDDVVRFLIANGARLLNEGATPLHRAAEYGHATVARTLLELHGDSTVLAGDRISNPADLLVALNRDGETPLHQAARNGHVGVVQVMLEFSSANGERWLQAKTPASSHEQTALHSAAANGHLEVVQLLFYETNMSMYQELDGNGQSLLMLAVKGNHISVVEWLLPQGNAESEMDNSNRTLLHHALIGGYREIMQLLVEENPSRLTCKSLVLAAQSGREEILGFLIDTHREAAGMYLYPHTTKKLLFKAFRQAQAEKLPEAARLLKSYYEQET
ncbi:MAG: hypothetical protein LQ349_003012 [Xanthoria aureola]|nr:MAG: hypothetical protein LQ349_003012 [Xanthoria aureola]